MVFTPWAFGRLLVLAMVLLFLLVLAGALIWVLIARRRRSQPQAAFPVIGLDGPGMFEVVGVDRNTRADVRRTIEADSDENARVKVELDGVVVTDVRRLRAATQSGALP